jgi:hypothetical protein
MTRVWMASLLTLLAGCSGTPAHPSGPVHVRQTRAGELGPNAWTCALEFFALEGRFRGQVTPATLSLEIRTGPCNTTGDLLASSSTGVITLNLQSFGSYHVQLANPGASSAQYSLDVEYDTPSI